MKQRIGNGKTNRKSKQLYAKKKNLMQNLSEDNEVNKKKSNSEKMKKGRKIIDKKSKSNFLINFLEYLK